MARENAAVDVGPSHAGERVIGMAAFEASSDAGGAHAGVVIRNGGKAQESAGVRRRAENGLHIRADRAANDDRFAREIFASDFVQFEGKLVMLEAGERVGQLVDGVFRCGQRAVAAGIDDLEIEILIELFAGLDADQLALAVFEFEITGVGIDDVFGVNEIAMIFDQPGHAVGLAALFIGGEREDEVAIGPEIFFFQANEAGDEERVAVFDVSSAAAVKVAVFFGEDEGVHRPIFAASFDHIGMANEQQGSVRAGAMNAGDEVAFAVVGAEDLDVGGAKSGVEQALGHGAGGNSGAADRIGGIDFDELLKNVAGKLFG